MGFAYYGNYLAWFETGRTELIRASGFSYREMEDAGYMLPVTEASCSYHAPAHYDDLVTIRTSVLDFRGIRLSFRYEIIRDGKTLAEGSTSHAFMDADGRPRRLSPDMRKRLEDALGE
ncbi:MAG: acyl-CoA thioesterase [Nitrospirae bacterium]|nr:acyl-CoA thioesterase [Nitrospirota bacterium]MBI5695213.1 acyl-CoA thioesterase [Nitrospirota bacterium]